MSINSLSHDYAFDLKLEQIDAQDEGSEPRVIGGIFITFNTLQKICQQERVLAWGLPLAALQRKIGENARFVLPDKSIIDDVFEYTLNDYRKYQTRTTDPEQKRYPSEMVIYWLRQRVSPEEARQGTGPVPNGVESEANGSEKIPDGPMKEKDWDYVFQANKILSCSYVDPLTNQVLRASHAAFRLKTSNEDDAEPDLPQDDERAKIPVWTLSKEPSRTYIYETNSELETSAMMSGHSKKALEVGLSGAYKLFSAEGKYGRTTESAYKNTNTYGKKESTMLTVHQVPVVELNLDKGNSRISNACRQALLKLRDERNFTDLMNFFAKYGTMYAKKVVLGGRLVSNRRTFEETMTEKMERQDSVKKEASLSLGIQPFSVKGSYSNEHGTKKEREKEDKTSQKYIDWTAIGGHAGYASNPEKWLPTVPNYKYWKIIQNSEVVSIQAFIGSLPGYEDIPSLFHEILNGGLYIPESLHLGPRPALPGQKQPPRDGLDVAPLGAGINNLTLGPAVPKKTALAESMLQYVTSRVIAQGGCSWQVLDTAEAVRLEILSTLQSLTNIGMNRSTIPSHLYDLSLKPLTISVVLQWSSDLIETGLNLGSPSAAQVLRIYSTLKELAPQQCADVLNAAEKLQVGDVFKQPATDNKSAPDNNPVPGPKGDFFDSLEKLANSTPYSSPAASRVASWQTYLKTRLTLEIPEKLPPSDQEGLLASIKTAITSMQDEDLGQQSATLLPFEVTPEALQLLKDAHKDKNAFVAQLGHQFIESYTEKASLTAVWRIGLPESTTDDFYALRMALHKYFLGPRTVSEVCNFLSDLNHFSHDIVPLSDVKVSDAKVADAKVPDVKVPDVKVSIFGYRDEFTNEPVDLNDEPSSRARLYLTKDALLRNKNRVATGMRPWQGLFVKDIDSPAAKDIQPVVPEEFYVLNTRKAERLLLLLKIYSTDPQSGVEPKNLPQFGQTLDKILDPASLEKDSGKMLEQQKDLLRQLVRDLQKSLPKSDPESTRE